MRYICANLGWWHVPSAGPGRPEEDVTRGQKQPAWTEHGAEGWGAQAGRRGSGPGDPQTTQGAFCSPCGHGLWPRRPLPGQGPGKQGKQDGAKASGGHGAQRQLSPSTRGGLPEALPGREASVRPARPCTPTCPRQPVSLGVTRCGGPSSPQGRMRPVPSRAMGTAGRRGALEQLKGHGHSGNRGSGGQRAEEGH